MNNPLRLVASSLLLFWPAHFLPAEDGATLYRRSCAPCHDAGAERAPTHEALHAMSAERVLAAMESGPMISMANRRSEADRRAIAEFITGKSFEHPLDTAPAAAAMCAGPVPEFTNPTAGPLWNGWGLDLLNTRFQTAALAGISASDVSKLKVKWAFGFPATLDANAHPALASGRIFIGSTSGTVYSLDAATGCIRWYFNAASGVRTAISIGRVETEFGPRYAAFFGDGSAFAYAVDAITGKQFWKTKVDAFPVARITGSPIFYNNRLYVPVASGEEGAGASPDYECCRFRGSIVALDAATGKQIWKTYTIDEQAHKTKKNKNGTQLWGPSGAPIWSSPAIDAMRNVLYVTTGDNYSDPTSRMSDAFVAFDLDTGKILWSRQMTASDAYTSACRLPDKTNCPESNGPDFDFSSGPILVTLANGHRALVAGQKSGLVHAVDPDNQGEVLWQRSRRQGRHQWWSAVGLGHGWFQRLCRARGYRPHRGPLQPQHRRRSEAGRRHVRAASGHWQAGLVHAAGAVWRSQALQSRAIGRRQRDSRRRVLRLRRRAPARLFRHRRLHPLGRRHHRTIYDGERRARARRFDGRPRPRDRRRHAVRQFRILGRRRHARQCSAGVFGGRKVRARFSKLHDSEFCILNSSY